MHACMTCMHACMCTLHACVRGVLCDRIMVRWLFIPIGGLRVHSDQKKKRRQRRRRRRHDILLDIFQAYSSSVSTRSSTTRVRDHAPCARRPVYPVFSLHICCRPRDTKIEAEAHHIFSRSFFLDVGASIKTYMSSSKPKTDLKKQKCCRMKIPWRPRYATRIMQKKMAYCLFFFRRFWVKEPPSFKKHLSQKEVYLNRYCSACAFYHRRSGSTHNGRYRPLVSVHFVCRHFFPHTEKGLNFFRRNGI